MSSDELATTAHESANALTVVLGWLERAKEASDPGALAFALERAENTVRLARDVLRRDLGETARSLPRMSVEDLARRTLDDVALEARRAGVTLELDAPADTCGMAYAPNAAWQILTNILLNALEASPRGATVRLRLARAPGDFLSFTVSDEGPGIPSERRAGLFTAGITTRAGGAGIGLRHARLLAREHAGELTLLERHDGAHFELTWPLAPLKENPDAHDDAISGLRVLLLEDDASITKLLDFALTARGASLTSVRDTPALEQALSNERFDVLLLDLSPLGFGMRMDAAAELRRVVELGRASSPGVAALAISGSAVVPPCSGLASLRKPFAPRELVAAIARSRAAGTGKPAELAIAGTGHDQGPAVDDASCAGPALALPRAKPP